MKAATASIWGLSFSKGHRLAAIRLGTIPILLRALRSSDRPAQHSEGAPCAPGTTRSSQVSSLKTETSHKPIKPVVSADRQFAAERQGSSAGEMEPDSRLLSTSHDADNANLDEKHEGEQLASISQERMSAGLTLEVLHPFAGVCLHFWDGL